MNKIVLIYMPVIHQGYLSFLEKYKHTHHIFLIGDDFARSLPKFEIYYNQGINKQGNILEVGLQHGVVEKKGAWLQFNGELVGQGKEAARLALVEKPELGQKIIEAIMAKRNAALPA